MGISTSKPRVWRCPELYALLEVFMNPFSLIMLALAMPTDIFAAVVAKGRV